MNLRRALLFLIFVQSVFFNHAWKIENDCSLLTCNDPVISYMAGKTCNCSRQTHVINIQCTDWITRPFTVALHEYYYSREKIVFDGLNKEIPFKFVSQLLRFCLHEITSLTIVNFCPINWPYSRKVNITKLFGRRALDLQFLRMTNTCINSFTDDYGPHFQNLQELDLSFNKFTQIPELKSTFFWLRKLDVSNNFISSILPNDFKHYKSLESLNISHNKLSVLADDVWPNLRVLDLSHNYIYQLPLYSHNTPQLQRLYLNNNNLTSLPYHYFYNTNNLIHLDVSNNKLDFKSIDFSNLRKLETLNLDNVGLSGRNKFSYRGLSKLKKLSLTHNDFKKIPSIKISNGYGLVDLRFNKITTLHVPVTVKTSFVRNFSLDISHNCIQRFDTMTPENFIFRRRSSSLHTFRCSFCCLNVLHPRMFIALNDRLDLSHNNITELNLGGLKNLPTDNQIISLNLSHNQITKLTNGNRKLWSKISILDISHNNLTSIENLTVTPNLVKLYLNNNSLTEFNNVIVNLLSSNAVAVKLAGNPWDCNCEMKNLIFKSPIFIDKYSMTCVNRGLMLNFTDIERLCYSERSDLTLLWLILPITIIVVVISALVTFYFKYKSEILYYMYSRGLCLKFVAEKDFDKDKLFDAFISYSYKDEDWVADFLAPGLETGTPEYKLCIHNRDWLGGEFIPDQIVKSVENSRRTIIVLTENFVKSDWSRMEFEVAYRQATKDKVPRLIAVLPDEVPDLSELSDDFKTFVTLTSYIQANKPHFWRKLRASMPRTRKHLLKDNKLVRKL